MTRRVYKFDRTNKLLEVPQEKEPELVESKDPTFLNKATLLLDRKQIPVDWTKVNWPFEEIYGDHLLVQISEFEYHGALEIPEDSKRDPTMGRVVMIGSEVTDINTGEKVLYSQFAGYLLKFEGVPKCRILGRAEVLGRVKENAPKLVMEGS